MFTFLTVIVHKCSQAYFEGLCGRGFVYSEVCLWRYLTLFFTRIQISKLRDFKNCNWNRQQRCPITNDVTVSFEFAIRKHFPLNLKSDPSPHTFFVVESLPKCRFSLLHLLCKSVTNGLDDKRKLIFLPFHVLLVF